MISSTHRFHGRRGLRFVYQQGKSVHGQSFALKTVLNPHRRHYRLAVVVSRKVEKSAVARNRLRRRLYAAVQSLEQDITGPFDIVLTVFNGDLKDQPHRLLLKQVEDQLQTAGVIAKKTKSKK